MVTFDKIKLITKIEYATDLNLERFETKMEGDDVVSKSFTMLSPFSLYIEIDDVEEELVIEFSGKILGKEYPSLISVDTIERCLENINDIGICKLSVHDIINDSDVVKCDVTKDIKCDNISGLTKFINGNIKNRSQYACRMLRSGTFVIEKNVTTKSLKKRMTIYDKQREMNKSENKRYMEQYQYEGNEFDGVCRIEMNLNSKEQVRRALHIEDNRLLSVLCSSADPIYEFMDEVLAESASSSTTSKKEYMTELVLRDCNYDIDEVEAKLRLICGKSFHIGRDMAPFREMLNRLEVTSEFSKGKVLDLVRHVSE